MRWETLLNWKWQKSYDLGTGYYILFLSLLGTLSWISDHKTRCRNYSTNVHSSNATNKNIANPPAAHILHGRNFFLWFHHMVWAFIYFSWIWALMVNDKMYQLVFFLIYVGIVLHWLLNDNRCYLTDRLHGELGYQPQRCFQHLFINLKWISCQHPDQDKVSVPVFVLLTVLIAIRLCCI